MMVANIRLLHVAFVIVAAWLLCFPIAGKACSCADRPPVSDAFKDMDAVFVGAVEKFTGSQPSSIVKADGSISGGLRSDPITVRFLLKKAYRGPAQEHLTVHGIGGTCDFDFVEGQTYLVYARGNKDSLLTDKCTGTHPISEAAEDIRFLENAVNGRPQGLLFGNVFRRMTVSGNLGLYPPRERLQLVEIWVERSGKSLMPAQKIRVVDGDAQRLVLPVEYQ